MPKFQNNGQSNGQRFMQKLDEWTNENICHALGDAIAGQSIVQRRLVDTEDRPWGELSARASAFAVGAPAKRTSTVAELYQTPPVLSLLGLAPSEGRIPQLVENVGT